MTSVESAACGPELHQRVVEDAAAVFERMMSEVDRRPAPRWPAPPGSADPAWDRAGALRPGALDALGEALATSARLVIDLVQGSVEAAWGGTDRVAPAGTPLTMSARAGSPTNATVWIHNGSQQSLGDVDLQLPCLARRDGTQIPARAVSLSPARARVPSAASIPARLSVAVPPDTPPGTYRGQITTGVVAGLSLPVVLVVEP